MLKTARSHVFKKIYFELYYVVIDWTRSEKKIVTSL